jgi:hypothetical protein
MIKLFYLQAQLQKQYAAKRGLPDPSSFTGRPVGEVLDFIRDMAGFAQDEVNELLQEIAQGRQALKPWSSQYGAKRAEAYEPTAHVKSEAIDFLSFAINICLAAGITHDNLESEYLKVYDKNTGRQNDASY